jgi:hypothetical protein
MEVTRINPNQSLRSLHDVLGSLPRHHPDDKRFVVPREGEAGQVGELVVAESWIHHLAGPTGP